MQINERLTQARQQKGLTQQQVADQLHVARQTVSGWENARAYPDIASLITLSTLYGLSLDELLKEDKDMIESIKEQALAVKQAKRARLTTIILDVGLLVILIGRELSLPAFQMSNFTGFLISLLLLVNLFAMSYNTANYQRVVGEAAPRLPMPIRVIAVAVLSVVLSVVFYLRDGWGDETITIMITAIILVPLILWLRTKRLEKRQNK